MILHDFQLQIIIPETLTAYLPKGEHFSALMEMQGEVYRDVPSRRTIKVRFGETSYFIKQHFGVGWVEIFKNLIAGKRPVLTAETEWSAIQRMAEVGIPTTPAVAYGVRGANPATLQSFLITEDLGDIISLETLCADWKINPPDRRFKRKLLIKVAELARKLHDGGMNHRDFYICHICLDNAKLAQGEIYLYLIDLHRVGIHPVIASTERMKDMAALYFSAMEAGLSRRDYLRVLKHYRQMPLRRIFNEELDFWRKVAIRAAKLYQKFHGKMPETMM